MRRRAGLGAIQQQQLAAEKYKDKGTDIQESQLEQMSKQMEVFREKLEEFAIKHKQDIKKNSQFRKQFQEMCAAIGVDPLASGKGFWSVLGMGDFYYELSVQVVEVCLAANHKTGRFNSKLFIPSDVLYLIGMIYDYMLYIYTFLSSLNYMRFQFY